jgi:ribose/xylose/arabinose/galactoside ABC-type transport system permease subunit
MTTQTMSLDEGQLARLLDPEIVSLLALLVFVCVVFGATANGFVSATTFTSMAFQLPELGLLTLAMLMPIISGGFNLAITFTANLCGLAMAAVLHKLAAPTLARWRSCWASWRRSPQERWSDGSWAPSSRPLGPTPSWSRSQ